MHYELYADSLFLMNFIMNLYLLMLVGRSIPGAAAPVRVVLGAALGAFGFLLPLLAEGWIVLRLSAGMLLGTVGMLCAAFRISSLRMFLKLLERLAVYSFGMGGAILFLVKKLPVTRTVLTGILGVTGAGGLIFILLCRFRSGVNMRDTLCRATLFHNGMHKEVRALVDSGNSLIEPVSGKPVCILDKSILEGLPVNDQKSFRIIPYHSIGKKRGVLPGYLLAELQLELNGMKMNFKDVYVAISNEEISYREGADAESVKMIVNPGLLTGKGMLQKRRHEKNIE